MKSARHQKRKDFLSQFDNFLYVHGEKIENKGEDNYAFCFNENGGVISVFDGCGGIGSRRYEQYGMKTGAAIASLASKNASSHWFDRFSTEHRRIDNSVVDEIKNDLTVALQKELQTYKDGSNTSGMKGTLVIDFPTTISSVLFDYRQDKLVALFLWAGDSRGYVLTDGGLTQITKDDVAGEEDAFLNLYDDGKLENLVSADQPFVLNSFAIQCPYPAVFITATDGCFSYFKTPMQFEHMLLDTLGNAKNMIEWQRLLKQYIGAYAGDDYTLVLASFGYGDFKTLRNSFHNRYVFLKDRYISRIPGASREELAQMWNEYRELYYAMQSEGR